MTARLMLERKKRLVVSTAMLGFSLLTAGGIWSRSQPSISTMVALPGFLLFTLPLLYAWFIALRCPNCGASLYGVLINGGNLFRTALQIRYCPYCGFDLDTEAPGQQRPGE